MVSHDLEPDVQSFFDKNTATWTYVVYKKDHANKGCAVIDSVLDYDIFSGRTSTQSADRVIEFINSNGLTLQWILETHIHADHLTASSYIKKKLGGTTGISKHILKVIETWEPIFNNKNDTPADGSQFDHLFNDNESFNIGPLSATIIHTPGHTPADTSYIVGNTVFVGDAMFLPDIGTGRCDFPGGSAQDSYNSAQKILSLPDQVKMYIGHDYPPDNKRPPQCVTTIAEQKRSNIRVHQGISNNEYVEKRTKDDQGKEVPKLLLPALQVNLRGGHFGQAVNGGYYLKIPVDKI